MKEIRSHFKLSQIEMAEKLGITQGQLSKIETGKREMSYRQLMVLYNMGVNLNWLISGQGKMVRTSALRA
jgi:transcriptional regulator with XRE-family HTH domain